ncbi:DNA adenine methylase [Candidatus Phytoplasma meliae]|uniref:DNA adenine methylase n=1 Tax=Candidatus Phytoplasma meliae TaxID=1848402 RepID=UPI002484B759|nr:DNA adenine methylase [Candidatus Phytoplasma meliae]
MLSYYNYLSSKRKKGLTKAVIFFILGKYSFRGILRYKNNKLYTSFGYNPKQKTNILNLNDLITLQKHFFKNKHVLLCVDYQKIIKNAKKDDFLFIDPPYYNGQDIKTSTFYKEPFNFQEQINLFHCLEQAHQRGAKWLYTNYDTPEIRNLFNDYRFKSVKTTTNYNLTNKNNKNEIIITNYQITPF